MIKSLNQVKEGKVLRKEETPRKDLHLRIKIFIILIFLSDLHLLENLLLTNQV
jgi:hypothetical protein